MYMTRVIFDPVPDPFPNHPHPLQLNLYFLHGWRSFTLRSNPERRQERRKKEFVSPDLKGEHRMKKKNSGISRFRNATKNKTTPPKWTLDTSKMDVCRADPNVPGPQTPSLFFVLPCCLLSSGRWSERMKSFRGRNEANHPPPLSPGSLTLVSQLTESPDGQAISCAEVGLLPSCRLCWL